MKKKVPSYFERRLDEIYEIEDVFHEEGHEAAERGYLKIVALLLLFIDENLRSIRFFLSALTGLFAGMLFSHILEILFKL